MFGVCGGNILTGTHARLLKGTVDVHVPVRFNCEGLITQFLNECQIHVVNFPTELRRTRKIAAKLLEIAQRGGGF